MSSFTPINKPAKRNDTPYTDEERVIIPSTPVNRPAPLNDTPLQQPEEVSVTPVRQPVPSNEAPGSQLSPSAAKYAQRKAQFALEGRCIRCSQVKFPRADPSMQGSNPSPAVPSLETTCDECAQTHSTMLKEMRKKRQAKGLCTCGKAARPGWRSCSACSNRDKEKRDRRREQKLCLVCGKTAPIEGLSRCSICKTRQQASQTKRRQALRAKARQEPQAQQQQQPLPQPEADGERMEVVGDEMEVDEPPADDNNNGGQQPVPSVGQDRPWRRISIEDLLQ